MRQQQAAQSVALPAMGVNWTKRAIRVIVIAIALAFALWALVHFCSPVLTGRAADGVTWA
jgi:hypothetical protein